MITKLFKSESTKSYLLILGFSLIAVVMHGYYFGVSDQEIFIPYILKSANPNLFPNDLLFTQGSALASFFYPLVSFFTRYLDLQTIFVVGYLTFQITFFIAIYKLAYVLTKSRNLAIISLLPFLLPKFIAGTANYTYDIFFGYRSVGLFFLITYLTYLFEHKFNKAAAIAAVGIWFHPLSIIPNLLLLPVLVIASSKPSQRVKVLLKALTLFSLLLVPYFLFSKTSALSNFSNAFDENWLKIIKSRDDYLFISTWTITGWAALGIYLAPIAMFYKNIVKEHQQTLKLLILTSFTVFLFSALALEIFRIPALAQFQLVRSITPLAYIGLIMAVHFLSSRHRWQLGLGFLAFIALSSNTFVPFMALTTAYLVSLVITRGTNQSLLKINRVYFTVSLVLLVFLFMFVNKISIKNIGNRIQYPKVNSDWIDVQLWAKTNTKQDDIFLVPPDQTGFRIFSQRPIIGDIKDGATVIYGSQFAKQWNYRMSRLSDYNNFGIQQVYDLKAELNFDYLITYKSHKIDTTPAYSNQSFNVYKY